MPLSREVRLGLGHTLVDADPAPFPPKRDRAPNVRPMSVVAKRLD